MRRMKYVAMIGIVAAFGVNSHADIAYQLASSGVHQSGGSWAGGPYTEAGFLYQAIWSDVDPSGHQAGPGGTLINGGANEFVLFSRAGAHGYGNIQYADTPGSDTQNNDSAVGGNDINNGFLYFRIFATAAAEAGDELYQSAATVTSSGLADVDLSNPPINPGDIAQINVTGGGPQAMNGTVVPEPTTMALLVLSGVMIALRRTRRD